MEIEDTYKALMKIYDALAEHSEGYGMTPKLEGAMSHVDKASTLVLQEIIQVESDVSGLSNRDAAAHVFRVMNGWN